MARASALQAEGQGFKSPNLHIEKAGPWSGRAGMFDITREGKEKR